MSKNLRQAIDLKKQFYIKKLMALGIYNSSEMLHHLTLSELKTEYEMIMAKS